MRDNRFRIAIFCGKLGDVDGVSLEVDKWIDVLGDLGHEIFTIAGFYANFLDNVDPENQILLEDIRFDSEKQLSYEKAFFPFISQESRINEHCNIEDIRDELISEGNRVGALLYEIIKQNKIDVIIAENTNAMPMTLLGGLGLQYVVSEHRIATIFHHHDFWWERSRFSENAIENILNRIMPPRDIGTEHVVISSYAAHLLRSTRRVSPRLIPNCEDFSTPTVLDDWNREFRKDLGFNEEDLIIVQPTRIIPRKRIEDSVRLVGVFAKTYPELASRLHFVISLYQGDELNGEYIQKIRSLAEEQKVHLHFIADRVSSRRGLDVKGRKLYTTRDVLANANLATYLSIWEGFGNAYLEAVSSLVPVVIATYLIYKTDIQCAGFRNIEIRDKYDKEGSLIVNDEIYRKMKAILMNNSQREEMTAHNFRVAQKEFGFETLRSLLRNLIADYSDEIRASRKRLVKSMTHYSV